MSVVSRGVRRRSIACLCLFLWAVAAALAGCGGGGDSTSTGATANGSGANSAGSTAEATTTNGAATTKTAPSEGSSSTSKAEFVRQANAICAAGKKQGLAAMGAYVKQHPTASPQEKVKLLTEAVQTAFLPEIQTQIDEIRALGAPAGDEGQVNAYLAAMQEGVDAASKASSPSTSLFGQSFKRSAGLARKYGLDSCAYG